MPISVSSDGHSTYDSDGKLSPDSEGDPFHLDFSMSSETSRRVFDLAEKAHYFQGEIDSKKKNLASTGAKTLTYKDSSRSTKATYNYSPLAAGSAGDGSCFRISRPPWNSAAACSISIAIRSWRWTRNSSGWRAIADQDDLEEMAAVVPILQRIATDTSVINPVRARAQRMIERAGRPKQ